MSKYLIFEISTWYSKEYYMCKMSSEPEHDIEQFMYYIGFCDSYNIIWYRQATVKEVLTLEKYLQDDFYVAQCKSTREIFFGEVENE